MSTARQEADEEAAVQGGDSKKPSAFVLKLYSLLGDPALSSILRWGPSGDTFLILEVSKFVEILPKHFNHGNFSSFIRQLNKYDFHKLRRHDENSASPYSQPWEFRHVAFHADNKDTLSEVRRKTPGQQRSTPRLGPVGGATADQRLRLLREAVAAQQKHVQELQQGAAAASHNCKSLGEAAFLLQGNVGVQAQAQLELWNFVQSPAVSCHDVRHREQSSLGSRGVAAEDFDGVRLPPLQEPHWHIPMDESRSIPPIRVEGPSTHGTDGWPPSPAVAFPARGNARQGSSLWGAKKPTVLVVEDDPTCLRIGSKMLAQLECRVETAENGLEAEKKCRDVSVGYYDLILMDIVMPLLDGISATQLIRDTHPGVLVVAMTANISPDDIRHYFEWGLNDVLAKPFTKDSVSRILRKHMAHLLQHESAQPLALGPEGRAQRAEAADWADKHHYRSLGS